MQNKGITLIEMVVVIVLIALIVPGLLGLFRNVSWRAMRSEAMTQATFYAEQLMEEIKSKRFDANTISPWSSTSTFGTGDAVAYNDVDDFHNYSDSPAPGYSRSVTVEYVWLNVSVWEACGSTTCQAVSTCANCNECCYKRITITVSRSDNLVSNVNLITIVSGY
mgnify:CR=1 FL=1